MPSDKNIIQDTYKDLILSTICPQSMWAKNTNVIPINNILQHTVCDSWIDMCIYLRVCVWGRVGIVL